MKIWEMILLGFIQGMTEFLPVSSSGHLLIAQKLLGVSEEGYLFYGVMLHVGTLIPVCVVFFKEILGLFKKPFDKLLWLVVATVPAGVFGIIFKIAGLEDIFFSAGLIPLIICYVITAIVLLLAERKVKRTALFKPLTLKSSFVMGLFQAAGVLPGISRSGITVSAGCFMEVEKEETASFAFLMSIPVILASALVEGYSAVKTGINVEILPLVCGIVSAAVFGYIAIKFMLSAIRKANYKWFSLYIGVLVTALIVMEILGV